MDPIDLIRRTNLVNVTQSSHMITFLRFRHILVCYSIFMKIQLNLYIILFIVLTMLTKWKNTNPLNNLDKLKKKIKIKSFEIYKQKKKKKLKVIWCFAFLAENFLV